MADTTKSILSTLIALLKANTSLSAVVGTRVYTTVPQNTLYPYVYLTITSLPEDTLDANDYLHKITIQSYSQGDSIKTGLDIKEIIYNSLQRSSSFAYCQEDGDSIVINHPEDKIIQTIQRFLIN